MWGIDLSPLTNEITKLSLTQHQIISLLQENNASQTQTNSLLQEQNQLLKKLLEKQGVYSELSPKQTK